MKCEAITANGTQCSRDALEGSKFCGLPSHRDQEKVTEVFTAKASGLPKVKNVIRYINKQGIMTETSWDVDSIDNYLSALISYGYKLVSTHYLGEAPQEGYGVLYILAIDD